MDIQNIASVNTIITIEKTFATPFNPVFSWTLIVKSFEVLPKHTVYGFISESFALNWYIFVVLTSKKLLVPL